MSWLSQNSLNSINANLTSLEGIYQAVKPGLVSSLGVNFSSQPDDHIRFMFSAFVAFDLKPYANSMAFSLRDLMAEDALDCDNYVRLAWYFFQIMRPTSQSEVLAVGWEGGGIGNHAQMQIRTSGAPDLYCDPTIGLAVHGVSFDSLCTGYLVPPLSIYSIFQNNPRNEVTLLNSNVHTALLNGTYRASQLLYVYSDLARFDALERSKLGTYPVRNE